MRREREEREVGAQPYKDDEGTKWSREIRQTRTRRRCSVAVIRGAMRVRKEDDCGRRAAQQVELISRCGVTAEQSAVEQSGSEQNRRVERGGLVAVGKKKEEVRVEDDGIQQRAGRRAHQAVFEMSTFRQQREGALSAASAVASVQ